jgi:septum formation protein
MLPLLLASASPRRRELLERVGVPLEIHPADIDEEPLANEEPAIYVARIAHEKARAVKRRPGQWVLAADTTVTVDGRILAKAATPEEAAEMLRALSGRVHQVITAVTLLGPGMERPELASGRGVDERTIDHDLLVASDVAMATLSEDTIAAYVASGEWRGKAGAYAIQGIAAALVREVRGSVTNIIGLPLAEVLVALKALGAPSGNLAAGIPA